MGMTVIIVMGMDMEVMVDTTEDTPISRESSQAQDKPGSFDQSCYVHVLFRPITSLANKVNY